MKKILIYLTLMFVVSFAFAQNPTVTPVASGTADTIKKQVKPIYSIFQQSEEDKAAREKDMGKSEVKCAPALPRVKSDDVIFAKRIIRDIYFADPANRYLVPADMEKNFIDVLMRGVDGFKIEAYQQWDKNVGQLKEPIPQEADALKGILDSKVGSFGPRQYGDMKVTSKLALRVIEDWYFDTNRSEFKSFIIAMGIVYPGNNILATLSPENKNLADPQIKLGEVGADMTPLFWVNYPTVRDYLCKFTVYHPNEKIRYTFDDVFQLRYFSSVIVEESNPEGNSLATRPDLKSGLDKLLESDRIKKSLIQYEQDMWKQ
ncbi:gliding motility protein GldN [Pedobacter sp. SD-b]|uniref:Gliding motility protein GldN n=1 Tax=Pedobacter segetis TaxID=2793069 RepID=A0ABS1BIT2_9SPHI|nr:gliding motility protein GldN [Pedobacter segetis]MBK0382748.1 gliding motility protein GldN [Pedobacter segetis]